MFIVGCRPRLKSQANLAPVGAEFTFSKRRLFQRTRGSSFSFSSVTLTPFFFLYYPHRQLHPSPMAPSPSASPFSTLTLFLFLGPASSSFATTLFFNFFHIPSMTLGCLPLYRAPHCLCHLIPCLPPAP